VQQWRATTFAILPTHRLARARVRRIDRRIDEHALRGGSRCGAVLAAARFSLRRGSRCAAAREAARSTTGRSCLLVESIVESTDTRW
jgi:hypothetical protein